MNYRLAKRGRRDIRGLDDLSRIERLLLEHVSRYRLTTRFGWRGAWELVDFDQERIATSIRRLTSLGVFRRGVLFGSFHYFELDHGGASLLTLSPERARPLTAAARFRAYAQLLYATTGKKRLVLAERDDIGQSEMGSARDDVTHITTGTPWGFFFEADDSARWSRLLVDRSINTNPNRIAQRMRDAALVLQRHPVWSPKVKTKTISLAVITPTMQRAERVRVRLSRYGELRDIPINVMVAPGLLPLMQKHPRS
jgi:hypothetical protein